MVDTSKILQKQRARNVGSLSVQHQRRFEVLHFEHPPSSPPRQGRMTASPPRQVFCESGHLGFDELEIHVDGRAGDDAHSCLWNVEFYKVQHLRFCVLKRQLALTRLL